MSDGSDQRPIIIKKVRKGHGGHHGGAWKVAFADFMTAMMAFFLVMWAISQSDEVKQAIGGYFRDPSGYGQGGAGVLKGSQSVIPTESPDIGPTPKRNDESKGPSAKEKNLLSAAAKSILEEIKKQEAFQRLKKNVKMQMTSQGLRIILNEGANSPAFFEPGSAKLLQKSAVILMTIAHELGQLENSIVVEGHTDAGFTGRNDYSNWELSTDRANSARQLMEVSGLNHDQIHEVRGYADRFPMIEHNPNDARNRRVSLLVLYKSAESSYDKLEVGQDLMNEIEASG